jgi:Flp pilus assembly pilin Flp
MQRIIKQMRRFTAAPRSLAADERGLSTVEYVIILVLIAVLCIGVWKAFGETVQAKIQGANTRMTDDVVVAPGSTEAE